MHSILSFCCACLQNDLQLQDLNDFDVDNVKYMDKLIYCVNDLKYGDYPTLSLCYTCLTNLKICYNFKKLCLKNSQIVKKNIADLQNSNNEKTEKTYSQILTNLLTGHQKDPKFTKLENCDTETNPYGQILANLLTGGQKSEGQKFDGQKLEGQKSEVQKVDGQKLEGQKKEEIDLIVLQTTDKNKIEEDKSYGHILANMLSGQKLSETYNKSLQKDNTVLLQTIMETNEYDCKDDEQNFDTSVGISSESLLDSSISVFEESFSTEETFTKKSDQIPKSESADLTEESKKEEAPSVKKLENKKNTDKLLHYCEFCNKSYTLKSSLSTHMKLHSDAGMQCQHCGIKVPSLAHLKKHMNKHSCQKYGINCNKNCNDAKKLLTGQQNSRNSFICKICNKTYSFLSIFKAHLVTHESSENLYKCKTCNKDFVLKSSLANHVKLQHSSNNYSCNVCKLNLNTSFDLRQHMNGHEQYSNKKLNKNKVTKSEDKSEKKDTEKNEQISDLFV